VRMARRPNPEELDSSLSRLRNFAFGEVSYDELRNTFSIALTNERHLSVTLRAVTDWIETEDIPITGVSTSEPSLEEIYLALSHEGMTLLEKRPAPHVPASKET